MSETITKRDIVIKVQKDLGPRMTQLEVKEVVQRVLDMIIDALAAGHTVELRNFGIFKPVKRKARIGRNPNNPSVEVRIPEKWVADFKPGRIMKMRVSELEGTQVS
jgi:nucleoid DNA-binding protein